MKLPVEFVERMQRLLGEEYRDFSKSFEEPRYFGLRVNTLKITVEDFLRMAPFSLEPVPWTRDGFYYPEGERPAKYPYYYAGLYYIQEPSAMAPGAILDARPGERVLDLCAAPGGKSTQIAAALHGQGLLVANDHHPERVRALAKNLELFGVRNVIITNETPERLAQKFLGYFDKILIDAPCSGEGMFRKDEEAARSWGIHSVERCVVMQRGILAEAARMLKPGGTMVYSTCTFAPEENEGTLKEFLDQHGDFDLLDIPKDYGFSPGRPEWVRGDQRLTRPIRLWPHRLQGEGHFVALLGKKGSLKEAGEPKKYAGKAGERAKAFDGKVLEDYFAFVRENLTTTIEGDFELYGDHLYLRPEGGLDLRGLKVVRPGLYLGMLKKNRFEPSPSLALAIRKEEAQRVLDLPAGSREVISYLKGETLEYQGPKGWTLVCVDGFPLGWGKQSGDLLKNYYPKGWRWMD